MDILKRLTFRGKDEVTNKWCYGNLTICLQEIKMIAHTIKPGVYLSSNKDLYAHKVDQKTLGQITELLDKNKKTIFEGDIVQVYHLPSNDPKRPELDLIPCYNFVASLDKGKCYNYVNTEATREILGNIHDNPEIIKKIKEENEK